MEILVMDHFLEILIWVVNGKVLVGQQSQEGLVVSVWMRVMMYGVCICVTVCLRKKLQK